MILHYPVFYVYWIDDLRNYYEFILKYHKTKKGSAKTYLSSKIKDNKIQLYKRSLQDYSY